MTGLFTLGFGTVFTILGLAASEIGQAAFDNQQTLTRVSGAIVIVMALYLAGSQLLHGAAALPRDAVPGHAPVRVVDRADRGRRVRVRLVAVPRPGARRGLRRRRDPDVGRARSRSSPRTRSGWACRSSPSARVRRVGRRRSASCAATCARSRSCPPRSCSSSACCCCWTGWSWLTRPADRSARLARARADWWTSAERAPTRKIAHRWPASSTTEEWRALLARIMRDRRATATSATCSPTTPTGATRFVAEAGDLVLDYSKHRLTAETIDAARRRRAPRPASSSSATRCSRARRSTSPSSAPCSTSRCGRRREQSSGRRRERRARGPRGAGPDGRLLQPGAAAARGPGTPASGSARRQRRHRRQRPRPADGHHRARADFSDRSMTFRFVSNVDGTDFYEATRDLDPERRCSSSRRRRSPRSRR